MDPDDVARAVAILRGGGVVAIPTETVYGVAGAVERPEAIARIYAIKGRPEHHPLIVHVRDLDGLDGYVAGVPDALRMLADRFWPGPLTAIVARGPKTPLSVTGGQETVAVRVPGHPIAHAIIAGFGRAVAAPSANRFGRVSPTTAAHVRASLGADVDAIVDGGPARIGVESTIVDLTSPVPAVLRAGAITPSQLSDVLGARVVMRDGGEVRAPGMLATHYAPRARLVLVEAAGVAAELELHARAGGRAARLDLAADPELAARELYARLRALDDDGYDVLIAALPPTGEAWDAVRDRLLRAAAHRA
jgi:L-threonylcarbamoyladenylate synthase